MSLEEGSSTFDLESDQLAFKGSWVYFKVYVYDHHKGMVE